MKANRRLPDSRHPSVHHRGTGHDRGSSDHGIVYELMSWFVPCFAGLFLGRIILRGQLELSIPFGVDLGAAVICVLLDMHLGVSYRSLAAMFCGFSLTSYVQFATGSVAVSEFIVAMTRYPEIPILFLGLPILITFVVHFTDHDLWTGLGFMIIMYICMSTAVGVLIYRFPLVPVVVGFSLVGLALYFAWTKWWWILPVSEMTFSVVLFVYAALNFLSRQFSFNVGSAVFAGVLSLVHGLSHIRRRP